MEQTLFIEQLLSALVLVGVAYTGLALVVKWLDGYIDCKRIDYFRHPDWH